MAKASWFPNVSGDVILSPVTHDDGSLGVVVVDSSGAPVSADFGEILTITEAAPNVDVHAHIIAEGIGFNRENERLKVIFD